MAEVEKGAVSVQMENLFPLIKKWLYSEKDIFARELVTNGLDAINKLKHLRLCGEYKTDEEENYEIRITTDKDKKTITFSDNGLGMTAEEIKKYISEVAFSGANDFLNQYKTDEKDTGIIGHFGLGFYSSFIISDSVEIDSLSYKEGSVASHWSCNGSPDYEISDGTRKTVGTDVILHVSSEEEDYLEDIRLSTVLEKYCSFMPVPIYLNGKKINEHKALWNERPADIKEDEYKDFYRYLYPFEDDPIFWIHINIEFPIRAKGILYFPKLTHELDTSKGRIKFYYNSVYVSDNLKDLLPPFLMNLRGAIDCPDMPLNVSRSYLQQDPIMKKLTSHITRKVSDELLSVFKNDRKKYEEYWKDINPFIKVGMMDEEKFFEAMKPALIFKKSSGEYVVFDEFVKDKKDKVYYATDEKSQAFYIDLLTKQSVEVLMSDSWLDTHFIPFLESKYKDIKFVRVDSEITEGSINTEESSAIVNPETNKTSAEETCDMFKNVLNVPGLEVKAEFLKNVDVPAVVTLDESGRRMNEMMTFFGRGKFGDDMPTAHTLTVNLANNIVKNIKKAMDNSLSNKDSVNLAIWQVYDLALTSQKNLSALRAETYAKNTSKMLELFTEKL